MEARKLAPAISIVSSPGAHVPIATSGRGNLRRWLVGGDVAAAATAWWAVLTISPTYDGSPGQRLATTAVVTAVTILALTAHRLYRARVATVRAEETARLGRASVISAAAGAWFASWWGQGDHVLTGVAGFFAVFAALVLVRGRYRAWLSAQRANGRFSWPVVIVGDNDEAADLVRLLQDRPEVGLAPLGYLSSRGDGRATLCGLPWLGDPDRAVEVVQRVGATGVMLAATSLGQEQLNRVVRDLHTAQLHVHLSSGISGMHHRRMRLQPLGHEPLLYVEPMTLSQGQLVAKRCLDVVLGSALVVGLAPVMAVVALLVKLQDGGPVLFRQERVGQQGRPFTVLKFRSMVVDSEARLEALRALNQRQGPLFKLQDDPRVTRIGRILRATSLDELPQLFNVLEGSMSLVGPRPALAAEVAQFDSALLERLRVKPGVSGLWQVEGRDKASFDSYRRLDLFYVENWSIGLDLIIITSTVTAVLSRAVRRGAPTTTATSGPSSLPVAEVQAS